MGYRSDVTLALPVSFDAQLRADANLTSAKRLLTQADETHGKLHQDKPFVLYYWDAIKWYDWDPSIAQLNTFLQTLTHDDGNDDYALILIGEEISDVEIYGNLSGFGLSVVRTVTTTNNNEKETHHD
jgi:hypothetical protein